MTDAAVRILGPDQFDAVVAHERAHLAGRHYLLVGVATVLQSAFGLIAPMFGQATRETTTLVEMIADEAAVGACSAPRVAEALFTLARGAAPKAALAASRPDLLRRVWRLTTPPRPLGTPARLATLVVLSSALVLPALVVMGPVAAAVIAATCAHPYAH
jgi:beta-lactamase regulating signal transducer with metallopeptidase domain